MEYVELSGRSDFNDLFIDQLAFPVMSDGGRARGGRRLRRARRGRARRSLGGAAGTIDVHPVPALLHNRPERIAPAAVAGDSPSCARATTSWRSPTATAARYGALDALGVRASALAGEHCYDVFAAR